MDDRILWLERGNPAHGGLQATLAEAKGFQAIEQGEYEAAAELFRESAKLNEQQTESVATLNNGALAYFNLFQVTGEKEA
ncbi:MAG: hypothetical protein N2C14_02455, partial [Planctomycetales bacterium]